jgi:diguanylate cyclase (GGDEF)-like protein
MDQDRPEPGMRIHLKLPQGQLVAHIAHPGALRPEDLLEADVRLTGVAGGDFDSKIQMAGAWMDLNSWRDVVFLHRRASDPWSQPVIPMDNVISAYRDSNQSQRVRIAGTLTYFEPGALAVVEQQGRSMVVETDSTLPLHAGTGVEATGFPIIAGGTVRLANAQLRPVSASKPTQTQAIRWESASSGKYAYNLVAMEGQVVGVVHDSRVDLFIILSDGHLFSATLRHSSSDATTTMAMVETPTIGSQVKVTGVCFVDAGNHWRDRLWFDIRMRSLEDVVVLQQPSWWTVKRMAYIVTLLSAVILIAVIWVGLLDRRLREQTGIVAKQSQEDAIRERRLARQEQERSHILELISSSEPLPEVLREIRSMVSSRLLGAPCWFELHGSAEGTSELERPAGPAMIFQELFSPEGTSLGFLLAAPRLQSSAEADISAAMVAGARLAELAIDTRRLYSDLRHRSEYDLLTDIPNRFSMDKHLDRLMLSATRNEAVFGLIYVDLDRFKQVNDLYGHRTGDLYLQEVTRRMKLQLRTGDVLARIGGDEFIALVPILRSRADAEEIAMRLERCFDESFDLDGFRMHGAASVGLAVYPEDGTTKEELQRSADAAMYANKETKRHAKLSDESMVEELHGKSSQDLPHRSDA